VRGRGASRGVGGGRGTGHVPATPVDAPAAVADLRTRLLELEARIALLRQHGVGTVRLDRELAATRRSYVLLAELNAEGGLHAGGLDHG